MSDARDRLWSEGITAFLRAKGGDWRDISEMLAFIQRFFLSDDKPVGDALDDAMDDFFDQLG